MESAPAALHSALRSGRRRTRSVSTILVGLDPAQCAQLLEVLRDNQSILQKMREQEQEEYRQVFVEVARILLEATVLNRASEQVDRSDGRLGS